METRPMVNPHETKEAIDACEAFEKRVAAAIEEAGHPDQFEILVRAERARQSLLHGTANQKPRRGRSPLALVVWLRLHGARWLHRQAPSRHWRLRGALAYFKPCREDSQ